MNSKMNTGLAYQCNLLAKGKRMAMSSLALQPAQLWGFFNVHKLKFEALLQACTAVSKHGIRCSHT